MWGGKNGGGHDALCNTLLARGPMMVETGVLAPVSLIKNDDLMAPWRQCHLLLRKHLDLVSHNIYASAHQPRVVSCQAYGTAAPAHDTACQVMAELWIAWYVNEDITYRQMH